MATRLKFIFVLTLSIIISAVIFPVLISYTNRFEPVIDLTGIIRKNTISDQTVDDIVVMKIDKKITPLQLNTMITYLSTMNADSIILDMNKSYLTETSSESEIANTINNTGTIGFISSPIDKGILTDRSTFNRENLLFVNNNSSFIFSDSFNRIPADKFLTAKPELSGVVNQLTNGNKSQIDLLYRFNNKYLYSLPVILYLKDLEQPLNKLSFRFSSHKDSICSVYSDCFGRINLKSYNRVFIKPSFIYLNEIISTSDLINDMFTLSSKYVTNLNSLSFSDKLSAINLKVQSTDLSSDQMKNDFDLLKRQLDLWNSFVRVTGKFIEGKKLIITTPDNQTAILSAIYDYSILKTGKMLINPPVILIVFIFIIILAIITIVAQKLNYYSIPIIIALLVISLIAILLLTIAGIHIYFYFTVFFYLYTIALTIGLIKIRKELWRSNASKIYSNSISINLRNTIADLISQNKWTFETRKYSGVYIKVDSSIYSEKNLSLDSIDIVSEDIKRNALMIKENNGVIYNNSISGTLASFGLPKTDDDYLKKSIDCAIKLIEKSNQRVFDEKIHVSLHYKDEWHKLINENNNMSFRLFGNIEPLLNFFNRYARSFNVDIIITETLYKMLQDTTPVRLMDRIRIKDVTGSVRLLQLLTPKDLEKGKEFYDYFHAGIKLFEKKRWEEAGAYFRQCLKIDENDQPSIIYLQRCKDFAYAPPLEDWDFIYEMDDLPWHNA